MRVGAYSGLQSISDAELGLDQGLLSPNPGPFTAPLLSLSASEKENPREEAGSVRTSGRTCPTEACLFDKDPRGKWSWARHGD